jgi:anthranilate phosphoribosyltransferase
MSSKACGPQDQGRRSMQVAGPTEVAVYEGGGITCIQPTPKSFRVNTGDVSALQARSNAWRTAQLKIAVRVHHGSQTL